MHCSDLLNHHLIGQVVLLGYSKERWVVSYLKKEEQNVHIELREPFSERSTGRSGYEIDFQVDQTTLCEEGRTFSITYKGKEGVTYFTFELPQEFKPEAFAA